MRQVYRDKPETVWHNLLHYSLDGDLNTLLWVRILISPRYSHNTAETQELKWGQQHKVLLTNDKSFNQICYFSLLSLLTAAPCIGSVTVCLSVCIRMKCTVVLLFQIFTACCCLALCVCDISIFLSHHHSICEDNIRWGWGRRVETIGDWSYKLLIIH